MRWRSLYWCCFLLMVEALGSCGPHSGKTSANNPSIEVATPRSTSERLTAKDIATFLVVRGKALTRLEELLAPLDQSQGDVSSRVQELSTADRDAAAALGVDWRNFAWVRDRIGQLLTFQRRHADREVLAKELTRAEQDLNEQIAQARDQASRQFLEAQSASLKNQLDKLSRDQDATEEERVELEHLENARADLATLQGRQERVLRRVQAIMRERMTVLTPVPAAQPRQSK